MPRPEPFGHKKTDRDARRRHLVEFLPYDMALDEEHLAVLADLGNPGARANGMKRRLIAAGRGNLWPGAVASPGQLAELEDYLAERGPLPAWCHQLDRQGNVLSQRAAALARGDELRQEQGPKQDPTEPGRYVQPSGRFK